MTLDKFAVVLLAFGVGGPSSSADEPNARLDQHSQANPHQVQVTAVALDLTVDCDEKVLRGTATLELKRAPHAPASAPLVLDTRDLTIAKAETRSGGGEWRTAAFTLGKPDRILGAALKIEVPESATQVRVAYHTSPKASALQWVQPEGTAGKRHPFLYSQSEAIHARSWIPLQDSPAVRVTYRARIHVRAPLKAAMSAAALPASEPGVFEFVMKESIPPYLIAIAAGDLAFRTLGSRTGVYAEPSVVDKAAWEFADTEKMVGAAERLFGPYRWQRYDLLVLPPSFPFGGMENARLTFATPTVLAGDRSLVSLVAHELSHSWSGNLVTNATWRDFWLNEGFTVYLERRVIEALYGSDRAAMEAVLGLQELREELTELPDRDEILHIDLAGRDPDDGMTRIPYEKGALFLTTVEHAFGRTRFDAFLRGYFDHFAFQSITTSDFEDYLRKELFAKDAKAAEAIDLHAWIHEPGLPAGYPEPHAKRFDAVDHLAKEWLAGRIPAAKLPATEWSTQEWLHFLRALPEELSEKQMTELDAAFHLTDRGNTEVAQQWLLMAIRNHYQPANERLETFLTTIGRRKYLIPLYTALAKTPEGKQRAREIFERAKASYHPIAVETVSKLLGTS